MTSFSKRDIYKAKISKIRIGNNLEVVVSVWPAYLMCEEQLPNKVAFGSDRAILARSLVSINATTSPLFITSKKVFLSCGSAQNSTTSYPCRSGDARFRERCFYQPAVPEQRMWIQPKTSSFASLRLDLIIPK